MRLKFLFALGFVLGASVASGEVHLDPYFGITGTVASVDEQGRLHFKDASYRHHNMSKRGSAHGGNFGIAAPKCLVTTPPESIALIFEGRTVWCRVESGLRETVPAECELINRPPGSMRSSGRGGSRLTQSEWLVQLGLMRPKCLYNEIFLVALPKDALTSDAAKTWQTEHHREPDIWPPTP